VEWKGYKVEQVDEDGEGVAELAERALGHLLRALLEAQMRVLERLGHPTESKNPSNHNKNAWIGYQGKGQTPLGELEDSNKRRAKPLLGREKVIKVRSRVI